MKAAITGASGFIGSRLIKRLELLNYNITSIGRVELTLPDAKFNELIEGQDLLINLAGAPIIARHTASYRKEIYSSRINTTRKLVNAIKIANKPPAQFITQSAIGIYSGASINTEKFCIDSDSI
jgi:NAD dependent epimerase/dehydratase family enzyme